LSPEELETFFNNSSLNVKPGMPSEISASDGDLRPEISDDVGDLRF
jgi:hypothetical protein